MRVESSGHWKKLRFGLLVFLFAELEWSSRPSQKNFDKIMADKIMKRPEKQLEKSVPGPLENYPASFRAVMRKTV
jgi:hypothetical protein